ncbi:MAG: type II toxin-antitoxin system Phd/YefM family antitoxin [Acidimicrobiales bacterium]
MKSIAISEFKTTCLAVLEEVRRTRRIGSDYASREPVAQIVPPTRRSSAGTWLGAAASSGRVVGDLVEPATDPETWEALGA